LYSSRNNLFLHADRKDKPLVFSKASWFHNFSLNWAVTFSGSKSRYRHT
jgi:hypothetical protein